MLTPIAITPDTVRALDAILELLSEQAERERRTATDAGDAEGAALCRNHARAYAKARFHAARPGCWREMPNGDLLVLSSQAGGTVYTVRRAPRRGDGMTPIVCTCDYGQRSDALGLCWHQALYIAAERLPAALGEARDADAEIDDDPELTGLLAAPAPLDGDWYAAEHAAQLAA